jgi:Na+/H+-dicarboxylate symporter
MLQVIPFRTFSWYRTYFEEEKAKPVVDFFKGLNDVIMKIIDIIMLFHSSVSFS